MGILSIVLRFTVPAVTSRSKRSISRGHPVPWVVYKEQYLMMTLQLYRIHGVQGFKWRCMPAHALPPWPSDDHPSKVFTGIWEAAMIK